MGDSNNERENHPIPDALAHAPDVMNTAEAAAYLRVTPGYLKVSRCRNRPRGMRPALRTASAAGMCAI